MFTAFGILDNSCSMIWPKRDYRQVKTIAAYTGTYA